MYVLSYWTPVATAIPCVIIVCTLLRLHFLYAIFICKGLGVLVIDLLKGKTWSLGSALALAVYVFVFDFYYGGSHFLCILALHSKNMCWLIVCVGGMEVVSIHLLLLLGLSFPFSSFTRTTGVSWNNITFLIGLLRFVLAHTRGVSQEAASSGVQRETEVPGHGFET